MTIGVFSYKPGIVATLSTRRMNAGPRKDPPAADRYLKIQKKTPCPLYLKQGIEPGVLCRKRTFHGSGDI
jgi:hypothetical protein